MQRVVDVTPSASRLTTSLRDLGYSFTTAIADLVDNSVAAGAETIAIDFTHAGDNSRLTIVDDGCGMSAGEVEEALRFGTRRSYDDGDLGRFGLGLKTASLSQCRRVTVVSRRSAQVRRISARTLDLDYVVKWDRWQIFSPQPRVSIVEAKEQLTDRPGTVVMLEKLDRLFEGVDPDSGWAQRRLDKFAKELGDYLAMVFHRFLEGATERRVTIAVNGEKVRPWNPFAPTEEYTQSLPARRFQLQSESGSREVVARPYILPPRSLFSTPAEFDRLSGPNRWNRQQGVYIYRANRMVQAGGWAGLRAVDEHTKLARVALDFPTSLDEQFKINVAKMRVALPGALREGLQRTVNETCVLADAAYRRARPHGDDAPPEQVRHQAAARGTGDARSIGLALQVAAIQAGEEDALERILEALRDTDAPLVDQLSL